MYLLSVFSPFLGCAFAGLAGRWLGARGSCIMTVLGLLISFILSTLIWYEVGVQGSSVFIDLGEWFRVSSVHVNWGFYFDSLTVCMMLTVSLVSLCVHIYSVGYMQADPHLPRFMSYLSMFTGFMLILVSSDNLLQMLIGWEGYTAYYSLSGFVYNMDINCANVSCSVLLDKSRPLGISKFPINLTRSFYYARKPAQERIGPHSPLFKQLLTGFLLGDGHLECHGKGARISISFGQQFQDVAVWYSTLLYGMGYVSSSVPNPLTRRNKVYYQMRTYSFESLLPYRFKWYDFTTRKKIVPTTIQLSPLVLACWIMGDGSGMKDGGFKISSHSFTREENQFLCDLLWELYEIKANVLTDGKSTFIRIWKRSMRKFHCIVKPYLISSCDYKFRFVKQTPFSLQGKLKHL